MIAAISQSPIKLCITASRTFWICGLILVLLGLIHIPLWYWRGDTWEGPLSLRKPMLFGLATGVTLWSFAWLITQLKPHWWYYPLAIIGCTGAILEVGIISLQAWRRMPSHYSEGNGIDALFYGFMEIGLAGLCFSLILFSWRSLWQGNYQSSLNRAKRIAILSGLAGLHAGLLTGAGMLLYGNQQLAIDADPRLIPPAGVLKFLHGMPIHAPQLLWPLLWFNKSHQLRYSELYWFVCLVSMGIALQTIYAAVQVFHGRARFEADWALLILYILGTSLIIFPWIIVIYRYFRSQRTSRL